MYSCRVMLIFKLLIIRPKKVHQIQLSRKRLINWAELKLFKSSSKLMVSSSILNILTTTQRVRCSYRKKEPMDWVIRVDSQEHWILTNMVREYLITKGCLHQGALSVAQIGCLPKFRKKLMITELIAYLGKKVRWEDYLLKTICLQSDINEEKCLKPKNLINKLLLSLFNNMFKPRPTNHKEYIHNNLSLALIKLILLILPIETLMVMCFMSSNNLPSKSSRAITKMKETMIFAARMLYFLKCKKL